MVNHLIEELEQLDSAIGTVPTIELHQNLIELQRTMVQHWDDFSTLEGEIVSSKVFDLLDKIRHQSE